MAKSTVNLEMVNTGLLVVVLVLVVWCCVNSNKERYVDGMNSMDMGNSYAKLNKK